VGGLSGKGKSRKTNEWKKGGEKRSPQTLYSMKGNNFSTKREDCPSRRKGKRHFRKKILAKKKRKRKDSFSNPEGCVP